MTLEEYIEEHRKRVADMTLAQARQVVADHYGHDDMRIECEKAVWMLLNCADEKINGGWIPVTERLPKEEPNTYWVCTNNGCQCECRWTNVNHFWSYETTDWHWNIADIPQYTEVVAWMPLPKPYKGGQEE